MRTVKASEVVKGMRVEVAREFDNDGCVEARGLLTEAETVDDAIYLAFDHGFEIDVSPDHPVAVLAEPEPEWVDGAWYRCRIGENEPENLRRLPHGWTPFHDTDRAFHADGDNEADMLTVLGRVLIVDWPGDLTAQSLLVRGATKSPCDSGLPDDVAEVVDSLADAIRTQGGAP